jgi:hypothetical protein
MYQGSAFPHEKPRLMDNFGILEKRLSRLHDQREQLSRELKKVQLGPQQLVVSTGIFKKLNGGTGTCGRLCAGT